MLDSLGKRVIRFGVCIAVFGMIANLLGDPLYRLLSKFSLVDTWEPHKPLLRTPRPAGSICRGSNLGLHGRAADLITY